MSAYLLLTAIGSDRAGLVDRLTEQITQRDLNIETSRMAHLGGDFAMLLLVSGEPSALQQVVSDPGAIATATGLQVSARTTTAPQSLEAAVPYRLVSAGMDNTGIVHEVARLLHGFKVGIEAMDTRVARAANSGTPIFNMEATLAVPVDVRIRELRDALAELGDALNLDLELAPVERP